MLDKQAKVVKVSSDKFFYVFFKNGRWNVRAKDLTDDVPMKHTLTDNSVVVDQWGTYSAETIEKLFEKDTNNFLSFESLKEIDEKIGAKGIQIVTL